MVWMGRQIAKRESPHVYLHPPTALERGIIWFWNFIYLRVQLAFRWVGEIKGYLSAEDAEDADDADDEEEEKRIRSWGVNLFGRQTHFRFWPRFDPSLINTPIFTRKSADTR
jgi:hypothetical protein